MVIFIYGEDSFRSREYLKEQIEKFKKARDPRGYNVVVLDGKKETSNKILSEVLSTPFLAERRMIVITNILSSADKELTQVLMERIKDEKIPESNVVVFWQGEPLSKIKEVKELGELLKQEKYVQRFDLLVGVKLINWIEQEVVRRGGNIDRSAVDCLVKHLSQDMWQMNLVLDQVVAYKKSEQITQKDVLLFVVERAEDKLFGLVDAVVVGDKRQAYKLLEEQRGFGLEEERLFGLLIWQIRILLEMRDLFEREDGLTSADMAKKLKINPYIAKKNLVLVKQRSLYDLKKMYQELLNIDVKIKTGTASSALLLDKFVANR